MKIKRDSTGAAGLHRCSVDAMYYFCKALLNTGECSLDW